MIKLYHPELDRWHKFADSAVSQMQKAGWLREAPVRREPSETEATAETGGENKPRRRRTNTEES